MPRLKAAPQPIATGEELNVLCEKLRGLQRQKSVVIKSRVMQANRIQAVVAGTLGYEVGMKEKDRRAKFNEADAFIKSILNGGEPNYSMRQVVMTTYVGIDAFVEMESGIVKEMVATAKRLPVASWVDLPGQAGFGLPSLASVVGETGNLNNYRSHQGVWMRMGVAPWSYEGKDRMGSTWRSGKEGKLPAAEWSAYAYSPRRRSISYVIGEGLVKRNGSGPYRARYLEMKARAYKTHPEWSWTECDKEDCNGGVDGITGKDCLTCGGCGHKCKRAHLHGMLCATKRLYKYLWLEWRQATMVQ